MLKYEAECEKCRSVNSEPYCPQFKSPIETRKCLDCGYVWPMPPPRCCPEFDKACQWDSDGESGHLIYWSAQPNGEEDRKQDTFAWRIGPFAADYHPEMGFCPWCGERLPVAIQRVKP
jgi:hypothetical protein